MWHDMDPAQQKILGIVGVMLFGGLLLSLAVSSGISLPGGFTAVAFFLIIALVAFALLGDLLRFHSGIRRSKQQADDQDKKGQLRKK